MEKIALRSVGIPFFRLEFTFRKDGILLSSGICPLVISISSLRELFFRKLEFLFLLELIMKRVEIPFFVWSSLFGKMEFSFLLEFVF